MHGSNTIGSKAKEQFNITMQKGQDLRNNAIKTSAHAIEE
jgi:hypothetical protein